MLARRARRGIKPLDPVWSYHRPYVKPFYLSYEEAIKWPTPITGWTPTRTVPFTTKAGLDSARTGLQDGDYVVYTGSGVLAITNSADNGYNFGTSSVATQAVFDFGSYYSPNHVKFQSTSTSSFYGAYINGPNNIFYMGGEYISAKTSGIFWSGGTNSGLYGAVMHSCGAGGLFATPTSAHLTVSGCWFTWESFGNNLNPASDPHADGGGGYHEGLIADGNQSNSTMSNNIFMCYGHDTNLGSGVQFGDATGSNINLTNNTFFLKAANNLFAGGSEIAMGLVIWGTANQSGNVTNLLQVSNYSGRATYCASLTSTSTNGMTIQHGRAIKTNQDTTDLVAHDGGISSSAPWDTRKPTKLIHQDVI